MSGVERFGSNLTLLSLSFARRGDGNLTLSLCDVPLLHKGEGRFGESRNRVRSGQVGKKQQAQQGEKPHPVCFADISLLHKGEGIATSPCRSATSLSFTRRGTFWRKPKQGEVRTGGQETTGSTRSEKPHPVCFADTPLLHKGEGIATSPCCLSPSQGEGRFGESQNRVRSSKSDNVEQS